MSLLDDYFETYYIMVKTAVPDGEGGNTTSWTPGTAVKMALDKPSSTEKNIAEALKSHVIRSAVFPQGATVSINDYLQKADGSVVFRVMSDPNIEKTPARSALNLKRADVVIEALP